MCSSCAVNGAETQCPTCRALSPIGFPYDANADMGTLWNHVTAAFQRELAMCIVAVVIFFGLVFAGGLIAQVFNTVINAIIGIKVDQSNPLGNLGAFGASFVVSQFVSTVINVVVQGVALVGLYRVLLDVLVGKKADLSRMFSQLHLLPQYIAMQLIMFVMVTVPMLIFGGLVAFVGLRMVDFNWKHPTSFNPEQLLHPAIVGLALGSLVVIIVVSIIVLPLTLFSVPELIVGQCGPVEALKRAWNLGEGQRLRTFGYSFVSGLVILAGTLLCCVGLLAAMPVAYLLLLALFLALRQSATTLPPPLHT